MTPDFVPVAEGSVLIEIGQTRVICTATLDDGVPSFLKGTGKGWVTAEYGMLPRATEQRTTRESTRGRQSGRTLEIARLIGRSLRAVTDQQKARRAHRLARLRRDSGRRRHAHRLHHRSLCRARAGLRAHGRHGNPAARCPSPIPSPPPASASFSATPCLDLCYEEDSRAEVDMNVVMTGSGRFVEVQATAEGSPFAAGELDQLLNLAAGGIRSLTEHQRSLVPLNFSARAR